ncbi:hypothetical protein FDP41_007539 [Naegleria fowleri]|uniref:SUEL-type lectin domain-containing protein n=1 Tax=Naegleria fowleri TaxID=5763 RepID=A0A6A5CBE9_NAEFO|nr:uncharacterized protein FDP41_007539 [Naegleria fowleri]KAF0984362.1 hypothetical protein FDP41_007539 [Naegleria fowleri]
MNHQALFAVLLLLALLATFVPSFSLGQTQFQMRSLYQGITCSGTPFRVVTQKITAQCNATDSCTKYQPEPNVLSYTQSCPSDFPAQANKKGEIYINTYTDASCSASSLSQYEVYQINTCMTSNVIFGPNAKSAKYVNCEKLVLYEDDACQKTSAEEAVTLNTCVASQKKVYRCGSATGQWMTSMVVIVLAALAFVIMM